MTLKQFLKPDWRKIILTLIIFLIVLYFITSPLMGKPPCMIPKCSGTNIDRSELPQYVCGICDVNVKQSDHLIGIIIYLISPSLLTYNLGNFDFFIIELIYYYLLSCFMVWLYDKFRKKKMK